MKERKDLWKPEEDHLLEETVLEYTSNGDTKASAFKKASTDLGRTVSACQYRWNTVIKKGQIMDPEKSQAIRQPVKPMKLLTVFPLPIWLKSYTS